MPCVKALLCCRKMVGSQQAYDKKGLGRQRNPPNKILPWVKRTISNKHDTIKLDYASYL